MSVHGVQRGISIYSFQELYYRGELDLEGCLATAASLGVRGIEMLPDQMLPGYPSITYNLSDEFVAQWHEWLQKYDLKAIAFDVYGETKLYKDRACTQREMVDQLRALLDTAEALGFGILRVTFHVPLDVIGALIPYAEDAGIRLAIEVHAPHLLTGEWVAKNIELAERKRTRHLGLMPDLGIFCRSIPGVAIDEARRHGAHPHIIEFLKTVYPRQVPPDDLVARVEKMGGNDVDAWLALRVGLGIWTYHDPNHLRTYMPYIFHVHGKFYEMDADAREHDVDYESVLPLLISGGYQGYVMSEYEGQRLLHGVDTGYDEVEQVRRHQQMLARYLGN